MTTNIELIAKDAFEVINTQGEVIGKITFETKRWAHKLDLSEFMNNCKLFVDATATDRDGKTTIRLINNL